LRYLWPIYYEQKNAAQGQAKQQEAPKQTIGRASMRKCRECGKLGELHQVQPFYVGFEKTKHVWLHPGPCSFAFNERFKEYRKKQGEKECPKNTR
jgi:hypothetical protein